MVLISGSKSLTNRALFLAAASAGVSALRRPLLSDDSEAFAVAPDACRYHAESAPVADAASAPSGGFAPAVLGAFGATVERAGRAFPVQPGGSRATSYAVEPVASAASYVCPVAALPGRAVPVPGLGSGGLQGDLG